MRYLKSTAIAIVALGTLTLTSTATATPQPDLRMNVPSSIEVGQEVGVSTFILNNSNEPLAGPIVVTETVSPGASLTEPFFEETALNAPNQGVDFHRLTGQSCVQNGQTWTCTLTIEPPGVRGGVVIKSRNAVLTVAPGTTEATVNMRVASASAPSVEVERTLQVGPSPPFDYDWSGSLRKKDRSPFTRAGATPDSFVTDVEPTTVSKNIWSGLERIVGATEQLEDAVAHLPPGLIGNPQSTPTCSFAELQRELANTPDCPPDSQVGIFRGTLSGLGAGGTGAMVITGLYNVEPPPGAAARFGFNYDSVPVLLTARLNPENYGIDVTSLNASTTLNVNDATVEVWGVPADASHNGVRGFCLNTGGGEGGTGGECPSGQPRTAFLRTPTRCDSPLDFGLEATTHQHPDLIHTKSFQLPTLDVCDKIPFDPSMSAQTTSLDTESPTGLHVNVEMPNTNLENTEAASESDIKEVKVALPQGVTLNPSQAEGLGVCSPAQYGSSELSFHPDGQHGCPADSKIGTVEVHAPLLKETIPGNVYVAKPYDNPFDSLLAIYVVLEEPMRGVLVKLPGKVEPDERTGRIVTTFSDLPQQPFSSFEFKFREGARAPLVTPSTCGNYTTEAEFTPWASPDQVQKRTTSFQITRGIGGAPCPSGAPGFKPGFSAGSINNNAGSFTPFNMRLTRQDGEQDMTRFSTTLPPGVLGKLAGVSTCPEAAIAIAKAKTGIEEQKSPSCPASSEIGHSLVGAGVGSVLTYIPGKIYLGGPFHGDPLSVIAITPAVAGPFDVGTVVVHEALTLNPKTAEVEVDGVASDPIPHILKGIPAKVRDLRVYVDKPNFILNPTSCAPSATEATLSGGGADPFSVADDIPVPLTSRFQAAACQGLGFKPKLALALKGPVHRRAHPSLTATYTTRPGDANLARAQVKLPPAAFLDNAHIATICTRVQFAAQACPAASVYGHASATSPILGYPVEGNVYLRSSSHLLPDLVADLRGPSSQPIEVALAGKTDAVKGALRNTFELVPDAPVTKFSLTLFGKSKGLIIMSSGFCAHPKASVKLDAQNGRSLDANPVVRARCGKHPRTRKGGRKHAG